MASQTIADVGFPGIEERLLVVFDGRCGFCNRSVRWFLRRDVLDRLRFAPSESAAVAGLLARHGFDAVAPDTLIVVRDAGRPDERMLVRSEGVLAMLLALPAPWRHFAFGLKMFPRMVRDLGYRVVAALRYRFAGRYGSCPIPTEAERGRFLG